MLKAWFVAAFSSDLPIKSGTYFRSDEFFVFSPFLDYCCLNRDFDFVFVKIFLWFWFRGF